MQYMLLIYHPDFDGEPTPADIASMRADYGAFNERLHARKAYVDGSRLAPATSATTVRVRDGNRVITDGPFAETKEWLGGYYVVEAASLDDALQIGADCPGAKYGSIEIRPLASAG
jgi:hypothetical protein